MPDPIDLEPADRPRTATPRPFWFVVVAGAYLTLRGYHSFDGDQAYRLPLLLDQQDKTLYAADPFVRAFDVFNPHRGYLAVLDAASRPFGLATGLFGLFALTLAATMVGVDRLARAVWPNLGGRVGLAAVVLVLVAKGGNIGTNHLFEATLLDRLVAFAFGWLALAGAVLDPRRGARTAAPLLGLAAWIHPSVGLQISLTLAAAWLLWGTWPGRSGVTLRGALGSVALLALALVPGLTLVGGQSGRLLEGMPLGEFRHWAVEVQGPQHMLPSTWRMPQWLAFGCYPVLAVLAYCGRRGDLKREAAAVRFGLLLFVNLLSLTLAYVAVEVFADLRVTLFQPFRMATLARGLALVAVSGRLVMLWDRGDYPSRARAVLVAVGLSGDWSLVVATAVELAISLLEGVTPGVAGVCGTPQPRSSNDPSSQFPGLRATADPCHPKISPGLDFRPLLGQVVGGSTLVLGLIFLSRHDTESGHVPILAALGALALGTAFARVRPLGWNRRRLAFVLILAWAVPVLAFGAGFWGDRAAEEPIRAGLLGRCRFAEVPVDDLERVAAWCRDYTPSSSRFIGPPGTKGFRLWSRRPLMFNRAGSPYHAAGLLDWSDRFRDHVGFNGSTADFARAYLQGRHALEAGYDRMTPEAKLALAHRQGATHVLERINERTPAPALGPGLELVATQGGYAVYRVK